MVKAAFYLLALLLAACQPAETDVIAFAVATPPSVLDPRLASDAASERINDLLYERLVLLDDNGRAQPGMATWQRITPTHYRLTLRSERARFWNNRFPKPGDVVATYRSLLDGALGSPHTGALAHVDTVTAAGEDAVDFHLKRPDPAFPTRLTIGIVPAEALQGRNLSREPLGSGSFAFVEWREDGGLLLERRRDGQRIALVPVADPTMRTLKLMRGEAQLLQNDLPSELYRYLAAQPGLSLDEHAGTTFAYLGFNLADPILANPDVRLAIAHAIDRQAIIEHLFAGRAEPAESVLRPQHWAGSADLEAHRYDPELARDYLRRAGYDATRPLQLSYKTSTDAFRLRIAHVLQSQLHDIGIRLKIASYDWGTFFGDIKDGNFQMYSLAWVGVNTPDILRYAFHSDSTPPAGANRGRYASPEVDALIERAEMADPDEASALYAEVQRRVHRDLVYVPLWYESNVVASRGLSGYRPTHDGSYLALNAVRINDD
ncbi:MAG: ABC transporter substrate-binding protein [Sedimenticolaceae bacterium]